MALKKSDKPAPLNDLSPMPFGQHAGKPMQDVPAKYLHWYWHFTDYNEDDRIRAYIKNNVGALTQETPDLEWHGFD